LGFGVLGLGFGVLGQTPNPQSPIPNPQSPSYFLLEIYFNKNINFINIKNLLINTKIKIVDSDSDDYNYEILYISLEFIIIS